MVMSVEGPPAVVQMSTAPSVGTERALCKRVVVARECEHGEEHVMWWR